MRIGIDARLMHHQPAGISKYTLYLVNALAEVDSDTQYTLFQHRRHRDSIVSGHNFRRATIVAPVQSRLEQLMLPVELLRHQLDLLHSTDFIPPLYTSVPTVITVHDLAFLHWPHFLTEESATYYGQIDRAVAHARHIIVPSESTRTDVIGQLGVHPNKVTVIYEAANPRLSPLPVDETRRRVVQRHGVPERYVLCVGTIEPRKNIDGLLRAFRHLIDAYGMDDVGLVIAGGRGWLYEEIFATVERLDLADRVSFLGRVSDDELWRLYVGARCHIHPAHYEGFGLPPLEAMACGTPTIVSNVSSLPEVVGDAALLINPKEEEEIAVALHQLLTDDRLHEELSEKGLQRARHFNWTRAAKETLAVYRQVVENRISTDTLPVPVQQPHEHSGAIRTK